MLVNVCGGYIYDTLSSPPVQSQRQIFSMKNPNPATIILIRDNSDEKEPLALYMSFRSAESDIGGSKKKHTQNLTVMSIRAAGERGLPCRNDKLNVVLFEIAGLPEVTMPDVFQESLRMIPAKAAKLERLIAESRDIDKTNTSKIMQVIGYGEVIVKVGKNDETTYSCLNDLLKQNSKEKFIIINRMITTSPGLRVPLHEGIYLAQQKNPDRGYVVKKSPGRYGADVLNMYPGYSVKFANLNQATKAYDLNKATKANENSRVKETQKKHGMNLLTAFFEPSKKKAVKVTPN
jgi:hypothetical protein